jgi:pyruvate decarboxylase
MARIGKYSTLRFRLNTNVYSLPNRKYNDITNWQWTALLNVFGDTDGKRSRSYTVHTKAQVSALLDDPAFQRADKIQLVEVIMDKYDAPKGLKQQADLGVVTH